jgi:hypothetical protein
MDLDWTFASPEPINASTHVVAIVSSVLFGFVFFYTLSWCWRVMMERWMRAHFMNDSPTMRDIQRARLLEIMMARVERTDQEFEEGAGI